MPEKDLGAMTIVDQIDQSFVDYLNKFDSGEDPVALVTLFVGTANSPLAVAVLNMVSEFRVRHIEVRAVFATGNPDKIASYNAKIDAEIDASYKARLVNARQFRSYNEQLVLGCSSYVSGPMIADADQEAEPDSLDTSDSKEEIAVATFAFDLLWSSSKQFPPQSRAARFGAGHQMLMAGVFTELFGRLFRQGYRPAAH
jgi:hypothetical protein